MEDREITVSIKNVYGNDLIYPVCDISTALCKITGNKTLTSDTLKIVKLLGYSVTVKPQTL